MKNLYVVESDRWVWAECWVRKYAELQAEEYLSNYWWTVRIYHYYIENPDVDFQVEDWELCFYIDDNYIHLDEREDYWIWRCLIKKIVEPIKDL